MRILIVHNEYGKFSGEEAVVLSHYNMLLEAGFTVKMYIRKGDEVRGNLAGHLNAGLSGLHSPKSVREIKEVIAEFQPDIAHIHNVFPLISPSVIEVFNSKNVRVVMTVHNYRLVCPNGLFYSNNEICEKCSGGKEWNCIVRNCEKNLVKSTAYALRNVVARHRGVFDGVDAFLCLTNFQKGKLVSNGFKEEKIFVLPNFLRGELPARELRKGSYFVTVGRISPEKGLEKLIEVASSLADIEFKVAGQLRKGYLNNVILPSNLELVGQLSSMELSELYRNAIALIHTSNVYEGFPMVFPEAMSYGLPIIAPKMAGYPEVVENNVNGFLYTTNDCLVSAIENLWQSEELCSAMGAANYSKCERLYTKRAYLTQVMKVYTMLDDSASIHNQKDYYV